MLVGHTPLVIDSAVEFSVAIKARMHQVAIAHRTIDTALVIRDIIDLHDVPIRGNGQATFTAQYVVCHSGNQPRKLFTRKHVHFGRSPGLDFTVGTGEIISIGDTRYPHYTQGFTINLIN